MVAAVSEKDLGLKVASRRLLWRMGYSTRIDVPLRTLVPEKTPRGKDTYETFTDLDVLGLCIVPGFAVRAVISDCKTSASRSTERMFWIRGVGEFFAADDAWMVRSGPVRSLPPQGSSRAGSVSPCLSRPISQPSKKCTRPTSN
jgi:hypothetical protein